MTWVTWRQHRMEGFWGLVLVVLLGAAIAFITRELAPGSGCPQGGGNAYCLPDDVGGQLALGLLKLNLVTYGLVVLPALAGAFIGAPLVAREIENGTAWLAWTQGVTRVRWLLMKVGLVFIPFLAAAALVGVLYAHLVDARGPQASHWDFFDQHAPLTVAATAFALSLGVTAGSIVGKSIPAMTVTLLGFVVTRVGLAELARPSYMAAAVHSTQDPSVAYQYSGPDWWLDQPMYRDAAGHTSPTLNVHVQIGSGVGQPSNGDLVAYLQQHGIVIVQHYQPADRFWTFQTIESAILLGLAAVLLGLTVYWVTRRAG